MERNNLIIALGIAMIVIESGETGGTREAARQTMKSGKPLFAVTYQDLVPGNQAILNDGASLLGISKSSGRPNIAKVINSVEAISRATLEEQKSLPL
jgi:predicted Rossmann fold nucleotide-binding protein DprA/Smf involved in DNA uptake